MCRAPGLTSTSLLLGHLWSPGWPTSSQIDIMPAIADSLGRYGKIGGSLKSAPDDVGVHCSLLYRSCWDEALFPGCGFLWSPRAWQLLHAACCIKSLTELHNDRVGDMGSNGHMTDKKNPSCSHAIAHVLSKSFSFLPGGMSEKCRLMC